MWNQQYFICLYVSIFSDNASLRPLVPRDRNTAFSLCKAELNHSYTTHSSSYQYSPLGPFSVGSSLYKVEIQFLLFSKTKSYFLLLLSVAEVHFSYKYIWNSLKINKYCLFTYWLGTVNTWFEKPFFGQFDHSSYSQKSIRIVHWINAINGVSWARGDWNVPIIHYVGFH